ncbi:hypothetical protein B484DRAFT_457817 [Ochromonadaceae sp. CCMP2298]|nr:hypothetical protein B484DRAFT_457817 [Ochromonadaceae sp. CCMP2298]
MSALLGLLALAICATALSVTSDLAGGELFAVVGGSSCGETLYYGPQAVTASGSADGNHPYFLSTNTAAGSVPHRQWTQVVSDTSGFEHFRIYWFFRTSKTLSARFQDAVTVGEIVDYRVVLSSGSGSASNTYNYAGLTWRFSSTAGRMTSRFNTRSTTCCFSDDDSAWGGASGRFSNNIVDGKGYIPRDFWGQGNFDGRDSECGVIWLLGRQVSDSGRSLMYVKEYSTPPTFVPTPNPTQAPTRTTAPFADTDLFAVVGGSSCGEALYYGPQAVTASGSADGLYPYFLSTNTASGSAPHSQWLQIVSDTSGTEYLRIYWFFRTSKTLSARFQDAVAYSYWSPGETVDYRIEMASGSVYTYSGTTWRFSDNAGSMTSRFNTRSTTCCFSDDDAAWGGASGTVNGDNGVPMDFFGQGHFNLARGTDSGCTALYVSGSSVGSGYKSLMYSPTPQPAPTVATLSLQFTVSFVPSYVSAQVEAALLQAVYSILNSHSPTSYITASVSDAGYGFTSRDTSRDRGDPYYQHDLSPSYLIALDTSLLRDDIGGDSQWLDIGLLTDHVADIYAASVLDGSFTQHLRNSSVSDLQNCSVTSTSVFLVPAEPSPEGSSGGSDSTVIIAVCVSVGLVMLGLCGYAAVALSARKSANTSPFDAWEGADTGTGAGAGDTELGRRGVSANADDPDNFFAIPNHEPSAPPQPSAPPSVPPSTPSTPSAHIAPAPIDPQWARAVVSSDDLGTVPAQAIFPCASSVLLTSDQVRVLPVVAENENAKYDNYLTQQQQEY